MPNTYVKVFKNDFDNDDSISKKRQATPLALILEAPRRSKKRFVAEFTSSDENRYSADDS
jgi:hypothetical protein